LDEYSFTFVHFCTSSKKGITTNLKAQADERKIIIVGFRIFDHVPLQKKTFVNLFVPVLPKVYREVVAFINVDQY